MKVEQTPRYPLPDLSLLLSLSLTGCLEETSNKFWQRALRVKGQHSLERTETSRMKTKTAEEEDEETMWPSNWVVVTTNSNTTKQTLLWGQTPRGSSSRVAATDYLLHLPRPAARSSYITSAVIVVIVVVSRWYKTQRSEVCRIIYSSIVVVPSPQTTEPRQSSRAAQHKLKR